MELGPDIAVAEALEIASVGARLCLTYRSDIPFAKVKIGSKLPHSMGRITTTQLKRVSHYSDHTTKKVTQKECVRPHKVSIAPRY